MYSLCFVCNIKFFDIVAKTFAQQNICRQHKVISLPKYASQLGNRECWLFHVKLLFNSHKKKTKKHVTPSNYANISKRVYRVENNPLKESMYSPLKHG